MISLIGPLDDDLTNINKINEIFKYKENELQTYSGSKNSMNISYIEKLQCLKMEDLQ